MIITNLGRENYHQNSVFMKIIKKKNQETKKGRNDGGQGVTYLNRKNRFFLEKVKALLSLESDRSRRRNTSAKMYVSINFLT